MALLPKSDPTWGSLLTGEREPELKSLASKLTLGHLRQSVRSKPDSLAQAIDELYAYFADTDQAKSDINRL